MCKHGTLTKVKLCKPHDPNWSYNKSLEAKGKLNESIDSCIAPLVQTLNDFNIETVDSCCTHHKADWSSIWVHPRHFYLSSLGFTGNWEKFLLFIAKKIINKLANNKRIEVALKFPSPKFEYFIENNKSKMLINSKYKTVIRMPKENLECG